LPSRTEHPGDGEAPAVVSVGDDQLDALETALDQALEKARPERLGLGGAEAEANDLAPAFCAYRDSDYCRD
jgi:hypothetical protein